MIGDIEEDKTVEKKKKKNKKRKKNKKKNNKKEETQEKEQEKKIEEQSKSITDAEKIVKDDFKIDFKGDPLLNNSDLSLTEHKNTLSDSIEEKKPKNLNSSEEEATETGEQGPHFHNLSFDNQVLLDKCSFDNQVLLDK